MSERLDRLWAGWRLAYVAGDPAATSTPPPAPTGDGADGSLFERLLALPDEESYVVHRGPRCSSILNAYPYTNGHLMALPNRAVARLDQLDDAEHAELWREVRDAVTALERAYGCEGVNVGLNLGSAGGAGVPDHLHVHVLPRWSGDTNFMTTVAETRVLPESLGESWRRLGTAWPRSA